MRPLDPTGRHGSPRRAAVIITAANIAVTTAGALTLAWAFPEMSAWTARLVVVLVLVAAVAALIASMRAWAWAGVAQHARGWRLLALPAAVALLPLCGGVALPGAGLLAVLIVGYAATAFFEEALFRGVLIGVLRQLGPWSAALLSSGLFACAHLPNMLFGQPPGVTLAQAVGTFCFGMGYAAIRLRIGGLWPLMVLHFVTDLALQLDTLPAGMHWAVMVGGDTVLLAYGLWLLRSARPAVPEIAASATAARPASAWTALR